MWTSRMDTKRRVHIMHPHHDGYMACTLWVIQYMIIGFVASHKFQNKVLNETINETLNYVYNDFLYSHTIIFVQITCLLGYLLFPFNLRWIVFSVTLSSTKTIGWLASLLSLFGSDSNITVIRLSFLDLSNYLCFENFKVLRHFLLLGGFVIYVSRISNCQYGLNICSLCIWFEGRALGWILKKGKWHYQPWVHSVCVGFGIGFHINNIKLGQVVWSYVGAANDCRLDNSIYLKIIRALIVTLILILYLP